MSVRLEELSVRDEGSTDMKLNPAGAESEADIGELVRRVDWDVIALGVNGTGLSIFGEISDTRLVGLAETPSD